MEVGGIEKFEMRKIYILECAVMCRMEPHEHHQPCLTRVEKYGEFEIILDGKVLILKRLMNSSCFRLDILTLQMITVFN